MFACYYGIGLHVIMVLVCMLLFYLFACYYAICLHVIMVYVLNIISSKLHVSAAIQYYITQFVIEMTVSPNALYRIDQDNAWGFRLMELYEAGRTECSSNGTETDCPDITVRVTGLYKVPKVCVTRKTI